jgi:hypothetical protein
MKMWLTLAKSPAKLKPVMPEILENIDSNLTPSMRNLVATFGRSGRAWTNRSRHLTLTSNRSRLAAGIYGIPG